MALAITSIHFLVLLLFSTPSSTTASVDADSSEDFTSLLQHKPPVVQQEAPAAPSEPYLINLRRESVPVRRKGEIVSHKTSYSGVVSVGIGAQPPQEFRVVFDTGSGHVIVPSAVCKSESCSIHRTYDMSKSSSSTAIQVDGSVVKAGDTGDQVKIGFGTGSVTGEFVRDTVCLGSASAGESGLCSEMHVVTAVEMSTTPFKNFGFDGILGLGLKVLALSEEFSFFDMLTKKGGNKAPHFGVFLTDGEHEDEPSEIAFGGHNAKRVQEPLRWSPVTKPELGYWLLDIVAVRVDGVELDFCKDGGCRGVMDTGTSHLGIPGPHDKSVAELLTRDAGELADCRHVKAPVLEIELKGLNITLNAENYMRPLPLKAGVSVGSNKGVAPTGSSQIVPTLAPTLVKDDGSDVERYCRPRLMPVNLPAPVGPKLFILGEPVLQRYYTVFDWKAQSIGMGVSTSKQNMKNAISTINAPAVTVDDEVILAQVSMEVRSRGMKDFSEESESFGADDAVLTALSRNKLY